MDATRPSTWPPTVWAAVTVTASLLRFDLGLGSASLVAVAALACGSLTGTRRAAAAMAMAVVLMVPLSLWRDPGDIADAALAVGLIPAALLAALLAPANGEPRRGRAVWWPLVAVAGAALAAARNWQPPPGGLPLRTYYSAVLMLALAIAFYYTLRLVARPARVPALIAALTPYWGLGILAAMLSGQMTPTDAVFHGLVSRVPGEALGAVLVAALTDPSERVSGRTSR